MEYKDTPFADCALKFAETIGRFAGYGSVFGNLDTKNDIIMPGAYSEVLKSGDPVKVFVNHGWIRGDLPIGTWSGLAQDEKGLSGEADLVMQMPSAINGYWAVKSGLVSGLSVAILPDPSAVERKADGTRVIHSIKRLKEISIVTDPANDLAQITSVKSLADAIMQAETIREFEAVMRDAGGLNKSAAQSLTAKAKALFSLRDADRTDEAQKAAEILARIQKIGK